MKNFLSYYSYIFKIKTFDILIVIIDTIVFIFSAFAFFGQWGTLVDSSAGSIAMYVIIIGSTIKFIYDLYKMVDEIKQNFDLRYGELLQTKIDWDNIIIDEFEKREYESKIEKCQVNGSTEYMITSSVIDRSLIENQFKLEESKVMENRIKDFIKNNQENLLPFLKWQYRLSVFYGKMFFNEKKLCLSKDLDIHNKVATCHRGTYYDTFLTNIISGKQLRSNQDDSVIADASGFFPITKQKAGTTLLNITKSTMNNEIGISTLGITSDNYLVIWTQNRLAQSSNGLLVPTGSGSCDWRDSYNGDFNQSIINAMKRELWEENGGKALSNTHYEVGDTFILGFFRWVKKGGKPEFVGITKVKKDLLAFSEERKEVYGMEEYYLGDIDDIQNVINSILEKPNVSVPLYMNLKCLENYYKTNREELNQFIFGQ